MNVLVTGGTGFVGLNIVEALLARSDSVVVGASDALPDYALRVLEALPGALKTVRLDVTDLNAVQETVSEHRPEALVHAAVITAGDARELTDLDRVIDVNVKGTAHVLTAALAQGIRRAIYVSSGSAYGTALMEGKRIDEATPPRPDSLYSITKFAAEGLCTRFRAGRGLDVVCARLGSVFGPWERDTGVRDTLSLPFQILRRAHAGEEVVLPRREARRDWVYAPDVASGILALVGAAALRHSLYNVSSGVEWNAFALRWCETLARVFPRFSYRTAAEGESANVQFLGEHDRALMSIERITADTGYRPRHTDGAVFADYARWLEAHRAFYE